MWLDRLVATPLFSLAMVVQDALKKFLSLTRYETLMSLAIA